MSLLGLLGTIATRLDRAHIPHMLTGSYASSFHGEPRTTMDVDVVIDPDATRLQAFLDDLDPSRFYVDDAQRALAHRDQFNVIEMGTQGKVDLIIVKDRPYSRTELARRLPIELDGHHLHVATAEDTILAKLEWGAGTGSDRQRRDVAGILAISGDGLDWEYLHRWAGELGVRDALDEVVRDAR
ncbi:MAG TPA: hypothetical protein VEW93_06510 [Acidimicrobiales bacterium]|nr:hypothetical protein [Acidimicrobiales bacterium]